MSSSSSQSSERGYVMIEKPPQPPSAPEPGSPTLPRSDKLSKDLPSPPTTPRPGTPITPPGDDPFKATPQPYPTPQPSSPTQPQIDESSKFSSEAFPDDAIPSLIEDTRKAFEVSEIYLRGSFIGLQEDFSDPSSGPYFKSPSLQSWIHPQQSWVLESTFTSDKTLSEQGKPRPVKPALPKAAYHQVCKNCQCSFAGVEQELGHTLSH